MEEGKGERTDRLVAVDVVVVCAETFEALDEADGAGVDGGGVAGFQGGGGDGGGEEER